MRIRRKHRIRISIGMAALCVLLIAVLWNIAEYYKLKQTAEQYLDKAESIHVDEPIDLVGLLDSYGVPYSPQVEKSFMDCLKEDLEKQGKLSSSLDLYGLYINKTWEVEGIFRNDVTIGEMKTMQNFGMDFVRHKYGKERIRENLVYTCEQELEDVTVASYYADLERPVVLYSCAANDLFYYFGTSLESLSVSRLMMIIRNFGSGLSLLKNEIKRNLETLTAYNPKSVIMVMGLYVPGDNFFLQRTGSVILDQINETIEEACEDYPNAVYVDVSCLSFAVLKGDFHPSGDGQKILKEILVSEINSYSPDVNTDTVRNKKSAPERKTEATVQDPALVNEWTEWAERYQKSPSDYVEWAVAAELFLKEKGLEKISYDMLSGLKAGRKDGAGKEEVRGINILAIERKLHTQFDLDSYSLNTYVANDKLSLMNYIDVDNIAHKEY